MGDLVVDGRPDLELVFADDGFRGIFESSKFKEVGRVDVEAPAERVERSVLGVQFARIARECSVEATAS